MYTDVHCDQVDDNSWYYRKDVMNRSILNTYFCIQIHNIKLVIQETAIVVKLPHFLPSVSEIMTKIGKPAKKKQKQMYLLE